MENRKITYSKESFQKGFVINKELYNYSDVVYITPHVNKNSSYSKVHLTNGNDYIVSHSVTKIQKMLNHPFLRIHMGYLVNKDYISFTGHKRTENCYTQHYVILNNGIKLPIAKLRVKTVYRELLK